MEMSKLTLIELHKIRESYSHFHSMSVFIQVIDELIAIREKQPTDFSQSELQDYTLATFPDEPAGSAMSDLFYQIEHPECRGNVQLARSEAKSLSSWITTNLKFRKGAAL